MCSHGRGGPARFALGSVADRLLRYGTSPLLLVRAFGEPMSMEQVVVPLDGSALAEEVLSMLGLLAGMIVQEVILLRVVGEAGEGPEAEGYLEGIAQRLRPTRVRFSLRIAQGDAGQAIIELAETGKLVVMATHGRTGLRR